MDDKNDSKSHVKTFKDIVEALFLPHLTEEDIQEIIDILEKEEE